MTMTIQRVAVIGAGTMGAGIAQVCAQAGWKTNLYDAFPEGLERGMDRIQAFWEKGIARERLHQNYLNASQFMLLFGVNFEMRPF